MNRLFFAKILLFGEYSLLEGSRALTLPYRGFSARLRFPASGSDPVADKQQRESNKHLISYYRWLKKLSRENQEIARLSLDAFKADLNKNMYLDSQIPSGYGMGSSGALVAAVYAAYTEGGGEDVYGDERLNALRKELALMESYFHGTSSGMDPLSCLTGEPLVLLPGASVRRLNADEAAFLQPGGLGRGFYLLDSGQSGKTGPMVRAFREKMSNDAMFARSFRTEYVPLVDRCLAAIFNNERPLFSSLMGELSSMQLALFAPMIPLHLTRLWETGLDSGLFSMKICGSGGGGFLLLYAERQDSLAEMPGLAVLRPLMLQ